MCYRDVGHLGTLLGPSILGLCHMNAVYYVSSNSENECDTQVGKVNVLIQTHKKLVRDIKNLMNINRIMIKKPRYYFYFNLFRKCILLVHPLYIKLKLNFELSLLF